MTKAELMRTVRQYARAPYTDLGGYPLILWLTDGDAICPDCARLNYRLLSDSTFHNVNDGWRVLGVDIYWEGAPVQCTCCNKEIESAYGDEVAA